MSTQTEHRADSIEHLDHGPECCGIGHRDSRPAAWWANGHGCAEALVCNFCLNLEMYWFSERVRTCGYERCAQCFKTFSSFPDWMTVVPL